MADPTIITCAITGNQTTLAQNPHLPCTPEQIANSCLEAVRAGAAVCHIHVRYPDGKPSMELAHYREVVERLRAAKEDVVINLTTGPGQRFLPSDEDPKIGAPGTTLMRPELRVPHIVALRPEISTLDLNTMFFGTSVVINTPKNLRVMADLIRNAGVTPELEVFDGGDIHLANDLIKEGVLDDPSLFQIVLGVKYGATATPASLLHLRSLIPANSRWAAMGIGRHEYPIMAQAYLMGGHVRVGLEDNIYIEKGVLATDNKMLVDKAVRILKEFGGRPATAGEAREMLKLKKQAPLPA